MTTQSQQGNVSTITATAGSASVDRGLPYRQLAQLIAAERHLRSRQLPVTLDTLRGELHRRREASSDPRERELIDYLSVRLCVHAHSAGRDELDQELAEGMDTLDLLKRIQHNP